MRRLLALIEALDAPPYGWAVLGMLAGSIVLGVLGVLAMRHDDAHHVELRALAEQVDSMAGQPCQWIPVGSSGGRCVWPMTARDTVRRRFTAQ